MILVIEIWPLLGEGLLELGVLYEARSQSYPYRFIKKAFHVGRLVDEVGQIHQHGFVRLMEYGGEISHLLLLCFVRSVLHHKALTQLLEIGY